MQDPSFRKHPKQLQYVESFTTAKPAEVYGLSVKSENLLYVARVKKVNRTRVYEFWKLNDFVDMYEDLKPHLRFYEEKMMPDEEMRLVIDLDSSTGNYSAETWAALLHCIHEIVMDECKKRCEGFQPTTFEWWHATREDKFSTHLHYGIWLGSGQCVEFLVQNCIVPRIPSDLLLDPPDKLFDTHIYPVGSTATQLRMPYSNHFTGQQRMANALLKEPGNQNEKFNRQAFMNSLITRRVQGDTSPVFRITEPHPLSSTRLSQGALQFCQSLTREQKLKVANQIQLVRDWLSRCHKASQQYEPVFCYRIARWRMDRMVCDALGDYHKGNGQYANLHFNILGEAEQLTFWCTDCKFEWPSEVPVTFITNHRGIQDMYHKALKEQSDQQGVDAPFAEESSMTSQN